MKMDKTLEKIRAAYTKRFLVAAGCIVVATTAFHLLWLGKTDGHSLDALGIVGLFGTIGWTQGVALCTRWSMLKQFSLLQENGPYDRTDGVAPQDAIRQVGGQGPDRNMWSS
jgi:hypothetical protein